MRAGLRFPGRGTAFGISANPPRAAVAARYVVAFPGPGVFASLGTPGYPPLAAFAAGAFVGPAPHCGLGSLGQDTLGSSPKGSAYGARRGVKRGGESGGREGGRYNGPLMSTRCGLVAAACAAAYHSHRPDPVPSTGLNCEARLRAPTPRVTRRPRSSKPRRRFLVSGLWFYHP